MKPEGCGVATGTGYWDALVAGPYCGKKNTVLVLVAPGQTVCIEKFIKQYCKGIRHGYVFGGAAVIPDSLFDAILFVTDCVVSNQNVRLYAYNRFTYLANPVSDYDVTGDGIPDTVGFSTWLDSNNGWLRITVNGKNALTVSSGLPAISYCEVTLHRLRNGVPFISVSLHHDVDAKRGINAIYQYQGGKFVQVVNAALGATQGVNAAWFTKLQASDNMLKTASQEYYTALGSVYATIHYGYSNGKLNVDVGEVPFNMKRSYVTTNMSLQAYSDWKSYKKTQVIPANTRVDLVGVRVYNGKLFMKLLDMSGKVLGWVENPKSNPYRYGSNGQRKTYFQEWTSMI